MPEPDAPLIVLTLTDVARHTDRELTERKNARYAEAVARHGGRALLLDGTASQGERAAAFDAMNGLLLTGGADIDPARYGHPNLASVDIEPERDALEAEAWAAAATRDVPVLGICRGFQAINVFSGGTLLQDIGGHAGPSWGTGPARMHDVRLERDGLVGRLLHGVMPASWNSYHHQAVTAADLARGIRATAWAASPAGDIVEAFERPGDRFVVGIQCHPERIEFSPPELDALWRVFVDAARAR
jgi:putative glutamine amidotransferase